MTLKRFAASFHKSSTDSIFYICAATLTFETYQKEPHKSQSYIFYWRMKTQNKHPNNNEDIGSSSNFNSWVLPLQ